MQLLLIDDDLSLLRTLSLSLKDEYDVLCASDANQGLHLAYEAHPDLVILDVMMPDMDGLELCRKLRAFSVVPIIFLSALHQQLDIIKGLNTGGDDYITKPFGLAELKARIEAVLRRADSHSPFVQPIFDDGTLHVDLQRGVITKREHEIILSPKEFQLLSYLVQHAGEVVPHANLLREVWGVGYEKEQGYLALYVRYLRQKIEDDPSDPCYIRTRFRIGYYFSCSSAEPVAEDAPDLDGSDRAATS